MRGFVNKFFLLAFIALLLVASVTSIAAYSEPQSPPAAVHSDNPPSHATSASEEHGLPQKAVEVGRVFGFPITNSMIVSWIAALAIIVFAQLATRKMQQVPSGAQNFLEWLIE